MDKKLIIASVVIVGLTVFYFTVVKKKSASSSTTFNAANLPSDLGQKAINKAKKEKPSSNATTATMKVATAQVPAHAVRNNNIGSTTNPCPQGFSYNPLFMNCVKQF